MQREIWEHNGVYSIVEEYKEFGKDYIIQEDDITNLKDLNFEMAQ